MARDSDGIPGDFADFVERRVPGLRQAAHVLSGNDRLADSLVDDLLAATALRWRWLRFTERRMGRHRAADAYLDRIFRREAATWQGGRPPDPHAPAPALPREATAELVARYWHLGRRASRRRLIVAATVGALLLAVCALPRNRTPVDQDPLPTRPTALPPLMDVLPAFADQERLSFRKAALPKEVGLDVAQSAGYQSAAPGRALAIFQEVGQPFTVIGRDGAARQLDAGPIADLWVSSDSTLSPLTPASLSPDGTHLALLGNGSVVVVDLTTVKATRYPALRTNIDVAWLTPQTLLISGPSGGLVLDPRSGASASTIVNARHALTGHGGAQPSAPSPGAIPVGASAPAGGVALPAELAERVVELLPAGEPTTAPARLRTYARTAAGVANPVDTAVTGASWLGPWQAPGFLVAGSAGRAARDCAPGSLVLPARYGAPVLATVVLHPTTGHIQRSLVATSQATSLRSMLLGWLDRDTALIRTGDGRTQHLLGWRVTDGELSLVSTVNRDALVSVADLGRLG